jgi:hypothetical protein
MHVVASVNAARGERVSIGSPAERIGEHARGVSVIVASI